MPTRSPVHTISSGRLRTLGLAGLAALFVLLLISWPAAIASARSAARPAAILSTSTQVPAHWEFTGSTTRDTFFQDWAPGSTWNPTFGGSSSGGTIVNKTGSDSVRVETNCSWSAGGDTQVLYEGQAFQVGLAVDSTVTGLTPAANLAGGDSLVVFFFGSGNATAKDTYSVSGQNTDYASGSGDGSFPVPTGSSGQTRTIEFRCNVDAGMGTTYTIWNYAWVEGPTPTASPTPSLTATVTGTISITPTGTNTETPTLTPTASQTATPAPTAGPADPAAGGNGLADLFGNLGLAASVIGILLAAAGLAAILIDRGRKSPGQPPKPTGPPAPQPDPPQIRYILQANVASLNVYPKEQAPVYFQALRVPPEGEPVIAPEANIQVIVPQSLGGLVASPASGMGSLECNFSVPVPQVCESLTVLAIAAVGEQVKARAYVHVRILPLYELELKWEDPRQPALPVDGKETLAWAAVKATPPDPDSTPDILAKLIDVRVEGPNSDWIRQPLRPYIQFERQWNPIEIVRPASGAELQPGNPSLVANFTAGGQHLLDRLTVEISQEVVLGAWVNGRKEADAVFLRKQLPPRWDFAEIVTFFHAPGNDAKPSQPTFAYGFDTIPIEAEPPILEVIDFGESSTIKGQYVIHVALKAGTDLETCFGEEPPDKRRIKVKVTARDDQGREYADYVTYRLRPTVTFCLHAFQDIPAAPSPRHAYREIEFNEQLGLVANGDDCLRLAGYFMLTEDLARGGPNPEKRLDIGEGCGFAWRNPQDEVDFGAPQNDDRNSQDGFLCFELRSRGVLEATPARLNALHSLIIKPSLRSDTLTGFTLDSEVLEIKLAVQFLRLRLWVVPGVYRHTSDAVAYLEMLPARQALPEQELCLGIEAPAGMALNLDDCPARQNTYAQSTHEPGGPGAARWRLRYSGMTWDNLPAAEFTVRAGLEDPPDAKWQAETRINVHANLAALLNALADDPGLAQKINNPDREALVPVLELPALPIFRPWDTPENIELNLAEAKKNLKYASAWAQFVTTLPQFIRENLFGPVYNLQSWFGGDNGFVCSEMRRNIIDWLEKQRFKQTHENAGEAVKRLERMNGLDFGHYAIVPAHVWAGIFPAGADRFAEYRALDPWWGQRWPQEWRQPENLITPLGEDARGAVFKAFNYILVFLVLKLQPVLTVLQAVEAMRAWLNGEGRERVIQILGQSSFGAWYDSLKCDSDNVDADGKYLLGIGVEKWFQSLIKDLK
jgi:hypothetical protein